ncbi:MAG: right-handed parallel beta-helix repeat-containing protein [Rhizomicrobium sp.]
MKALDQVEARTIINAANTPGDATNQFIINAPGSYYVTGNITGVSGKNGILINAGNVSIDLNGFTLTGCGLAGITTNGIPQTNITVRSGVIYASGGVGIDLGNSYGPLIERVIVMASGNVGMKLGDGSVARDCISRNNTSHNIVTGVSANLTRCTAVGSTNGNGIILQGVAIDCVANYNASFGIAAGDKALVSHCAAFYNVGGGIVVGNSATIANCTVSGTGTAAGTAIGIVTGNAGTVTDCSSSYNTVAYGIVVNPDSIVRHCTASNNTSAQASSGGIQALSSSVIGCTANNNATTNATASHLTGMGIYAIGDSTIKNSTCNYNKGDGINVLSNSIVTENQCNHNGTDGIYTTGNSNRIESNHANSNSGFGIHANADFVLRNTASNNSPAGNFFPTSGAGIAPIQTASTATNPFANLQ